MGKFTQDATELLRLVGGRDNIAAVSHCMTRMRFALADPAKADIKAIEAMKVVKGSFTQSGQFQVIIGNAVADFYNDFIAVAGMEGALASVLGGLVSRPVIAVPTSVGYGASFHGLSALLTMINSCANGVAVVNIDNGYGAGYIATQINRLGRTSA